MLVHIAPHKERKHIQRAGLHPGKGSAGVYCTPLSRDFMRSHQWVREIKRTHGGRSFVAVYFSMPLDTEVIIGHYATRANESRPCLPLQEAITLFNAQRDLGWEIILPHGVPASAIARIRPVPLVGWRYYPGAHGHFCACPGCLSRGEYNSRRARLAYEQERGGGARRETYHDLLAALTHAATQLAREIPLPEDPDETPEDAMTDCAPPEILDPLLEIARRMAGTSQDLLFLEGHPHATVVAALAEGLAAYRDAHARETLVRLLGHDALCVRYSAYQALVESGRADLLQTLSPDQRRALDPIIAEYARQNPS